MNFDNEPKPKGGINPVIIGGLLLVFCIIVAVVVYFMYSDDSLGSSSPGSSSAGSTIKEEESEEEEYEYEYEYEPQETTTSGVVGSSVPPSSIVGSSVPVSSSSSYSSVPGSSSSSGGPDSIISSVDNRVGVRKGPFEGEEQSQKISIYKVDENKVGNGGSGFIQPKYDDAPHTLNYGNNPGKNLGWQQIKIDGVCEDITLGTTNTDKLVDSGTNSSYDACYIQPNGNYMCMPVTQFRNKEDGCYFFHHNNMGDESLATFREDGGWDGDQTNRVELRHRTIPR